MSRASEYNIHPLAYWATIVLGIIIGVTGLVLLGGGIWLATLGGSWYYLIAGIGLVATGGLMLAGRQLAIPVYIATFLFTLIWALWEAGYDGWAQVPRLVAPAVLLVLVLLTNPVLRKLHRLNWQRSHYRMAGSTAVVIGALALIMPLALHQIHAYGQDQEPVPAIEPIPEVVTTDKGGAVTQPAAVAMAGEDWPAYGGTNLATRYSPLDQITPENAGQLQQAWIFHTGDTPSEAAEGKYSPENTPIKVGDTLYTCTPKNIVVAIDALTGEEEWRYDPVVPDDAIPYGATCRGVAYYEAPNADPDSLCATRIIEGTLDARLIAVDATLGQPCTDFGLNGEVDLGKGIGDTVPGWYGHVAVPVIVRGVVVVGAQVKDGQAEDAPSGVIRGYDAVTGELAWAWDMCNPELTGEPPEGQVYTRGTPNMWTTAAGDDELGYVYVPLGNSAVDYYGGNRKDCENQFNSSLVAIDVTTGKPVWHFQTVHYDIWDYDLGSQPSLVDFPTATGTTPAVILASKQGQIFVLDRRTGKSLFPVEERDVSKGGVEAEALYPTQPFSGYHSLIMPALTEADMWGISPVDQMFCRIQFRLAEYNGPYTPPTLDTPFIEYPGYNGGSDWGSVAIDTKRGILIANYNDMPNYNQLLTREEADKRGLTPITVPHGRHDDPQAGAPYAIAVNAGWRMPTGLMCKEPPYGGIRAIDLGTGKTIWDRPLGQAKANGPFGIPSLLPVDIGTPNNGGAVVTKGGLVFIAAATDNMLRAIDIRTGETVWSVDLPGGGQSNPMVFETDGREFVAIAPGGHHFMETPISDAIVAYALPEDAASG